MKDDVDSDDLDLFIKFFQLLNTWINKEGYGILSHHDKDLYFIINECFGMSS